MNTVFKASFLAKLLNMKRLGEEIELNIKVEKWIGENINKLYNTYLRSGQQNTLYKSQNLLHKLKQMSILRQAQEQKNFNDQKNNMPEYLEKDLFMKILMENSEKKIKEKCMHKYKKKYFELKAISHKNVNFELKNKYIEDQIEKNF